MPKLGYGYAHYSGNPSSSAVLPNELSGLSLWLKSDAGIILAEELFIGEWQDQSGNGIIAYPNDQYPILVPNDINGYPSIRLTTIANDNKSLYLTANPMGSIGTTAFVVNKVDSSVSLADANGALLGNFGNAEDGSHWPYGLQNSVYDSFCTTTRKNDLGLPDGIYDWNIYSSHSEDNNWKLFFNGYLFAIDDANIYSNGIAADEGPYIGVQTNAGTTRLFKGKIAEIIIYNRVLTDVERNRVQLYLNSKYAIY